LQQHRALSREDEKISNLRESMVSVERLLLFLMSEGRLENAPTSMREATKTALRDLQTMEQDASFKEMADALPAFPISSRMRLQADR
jgi:hypothetical protein